MKYAPDKSGNAAENERLRSALRTKIEAEIALIEADEAFKTQPASYQINGPLALVQTALDSRRCALLWVLDTDEVTP